MPLLEPIEAEKILNTHAITMAATAVPFDQSTGCVITENILADRDFPPFDRVTMDGIAINSLAYHAGQRKFKIQAIQYAGEKALTLEDQQFCIEVMTGTPLPIGTDSVLRIEDVSISDGWATLADNLKLQINIHTKGSDRKKGDVILKAGHQIRPADLAVLATIGLGFVRVHQKPKVAFITSGDELVGVNQTPAPHQIRKSNVYAVTEILKSYADKPFHLHLPDDLFIIEKSIGKCLNEYDVLILSGGVSAGKKDFIPQALENLGVQRHFHKISQRPGKPMWFGTFKNKVIFALPGNPVSAFLCAVRYVKPWFMHNLGLQPIEEKALLAHDVSFKPELTYFLQVNLKNENGTLKAYAIEGHGSGDLANLSDADAFLELPARSTEHYKAGEAFVFWRF